MGRRSALVGLLLAVSLGGVVHATDERIPAEIWDPDAGTFGPTGALAEERFSHAATVFDDGRVLVVGGGDAVTTSSLASAEIWDQSSGEFSPAGPMHVARTLPAVALLQDGRVLVAGGSRLDGDDVVVLASVEIWDPATETFGAAGELSEARAGHSATVLPDGQILLAGGYRHVGEELRRNASAETWDTDLGESTPASPLHAPRAEHTATVLPDGGVLIVGGAVSLPEEMWDPALERFESTAAVSHTRRFGHTASPLADGHVLIVGGLGADYSPFIAESWDPATESFEGAGLLEDGRFKHTATVLRDGRVLIVGGRGADGKLASAWLWDPTSGEFAPTGPLAYPRSHHTATLLGDGRVLIVGGAEPDAE